MRIYYHGACGLAIVRDTLYRYELLLLLAVVGGQVTRTAQQNGQENQKYLQMTDKLRARFQKEKRMMSQRKDYHIYSCPGCGQKIRIPRGGFKKVEIECPKCHTKFIKRR